MIFNDNQCHLTKLVGDIYLRYKYLCYVNDISRNYLVRYVCGTSEQVIKAIRVRKVIQVIKVIQR